MELQGAPSAKAEAIAASPRYLIQPEYGPEGAVLPMMTVPDEKTVVSALGPNGEKGEIAFDETYPSQMPETVMNAAEWADFVKEANQTVHSVLGNNPMQNPATRLCAASAPCLIMSATVVAILYGFYMLSGAQEIIVPGILLFVGGFCSMVTLLVLARLVRSRTGELMTQLQNFCERQNRLWLPRGAVWMVYCTYSYRSIVIWLGCSIVLDGDSTDRSSVAAAGAHEVYDASAGGASGAYSLASDPSSASGRSGREPLTEERAVGDESSKEGQAGQPMDLAATAITIPEDPLPASSPPTGFGRV